MNEWAALPAMGQLFSQAKETLGGRHPEIRRQPRSFTFNVVLIRDCHTLLPKRSKRRNDASGSRAAAW
jgi:hypothetical protein